MYEIIKIYKQSIGATRFVGKKYGDADRVDGSFGAKWGEWFANGWFGSIEKLYGGKLTDIYEDGDAYVGLMRDGPDGVFEYWIGMFMPEGAGVPDGFSYIDFNAGSLGVCWVYGSEPDIYMREGECGSRLLEEGYEITADWCFERYGCPRFTTPDDKGNVILDICFFVK